MRALSSALLFIAVAFMLLIAAWSHLKNPVSVPHQDSNKNAIHEDIESIPNESTQELESAFPDQEVIDPYQHTLVAPTDLIGDLQKTFQEHFEEANPESTYLISKVATNCILASDFDTVEQFLQAADTVPTPKVYLEVIPPLISICNEIKTEKPEKLTMDEWAYELLQTSSSNGHLVAQLELLNVYLPISAQNYSITAEILESAVAADDYRTFYQAALFFNKYRSARVNTDPENIEPAMWRLLGCQSHPQCNEKRMIEALENELLPSSVEKVVSGANRLATSIEKNEAISFFDPHTMNYIKDLK